MERLAADGKSLAHVGDKVLFVPGVVPGDRVDVQVTRRKGGAWEGHVVNWHEMSPERVDVPCAHFGTCGGCQWQMLPYEMQIAAKQEQVYDQLQRIGKVEMLEQRPILPAESTLYYRNKLEFTFSPRGWVTEKQEEGAPLPKALGFHVPRRFDRVMDVQECHLEPDPANAIRNAVRQFAIARGYSFYDAKAQEGWLRNLMIRVVTTGEVMVLLVIQHEDEEKREALLGHIRDTFPGIASLLWCVNGKVNDTIYDLPVQVFSGRAFIEEELGDLRFAIGPKSFYQTNSRQAERLYGVVRDLADLQGNEIVYDLYTGTGTIALFLARKAGKVVGIETVPEAIEDAWVNARRNGIENVDFYAGDVLKMLTEQFALLHGQPDVLVTDPPRAGMHPKVVEMLLTLAPRRIVYVSCNPATQARDLALLDAKYRVEVVQPVDMFPHTKHVENVVRLALREVMGEG